MIYYTNKNAKILGKIIQIHQEIQVYEKDKIIMLIHL